MNDDINKMILEHEKGYRNAVLEIIKNNTDVLVNEDIKSLLNTPPLDSMDTIKCKFLELAKKNKIVLNTDKLNNMISKYRKSLLKSCKDIYSLRIDVLNNIVTKYDLSKKNSVIKINKKDFIELNKKIRKILKNYLKDGYDNVIDKQIKTIFDDDIDKDIYEKYVCDISKFINNTFQKQLFESFEIKVLVKDTTLINATKEQGERYIYILSNSRIFNDI